MNLFLINSLTVVTLFYLNCMCIYTVCSQNIPVEIKTSTVFVAKTHPFYCDINQHVDLHSFLEICIFAFLLRVK